MDNVIEQVQECDGREGAGVMGEKEEGVWRERKVNGSGSCDSTAATHTAQTIEFAGLSNYLTI